MRKWLLGLLLALVPALASAQIIITPVNGVATVDASTCPSPSGGAQSCSFQIVLTANTTLSIINARGTIDLFIVENSVGGWTFTWPSIVVSPPTVTLTANATTLATLKFNPSLGQWYVSGGAGGITSVTSLPATCTAPSTVFLTTGNIGYYDCIGGVYVGRATPTSPQQTAIRFATQCSASDPNCFQVFADGQYAVGATYSANTSNGTAAIAVTTNDNDSGAQWLQFNTAQTNVGGMMTSTSGGSNSILAAFKVSGTPTLVGCQGTNDTAGGATTITVAATPTGGSGHLLIAFAAQFTPDLATITFSDPSNGTWTNVLSQPNVNTGNDSTQMAYVANGAAGPYTVTATFSASSTFRSAFVCEFSGMATSNVLDAATGGGGTTTIWSGTITTTGNDILFQAARSNASSSTFTAGTLGIAANTITTNAFDPPFVAGDVGKKILLSTACQSANGFTAPCSNVSPNNFVKIAAVNSAHNITPSTLLNQANTAADAHGLTGYLYWMHDDAPTYQTGFAKAITIPGATVFLPCGLSGLSSLPFNVPTATFPRYNPNIAGCVGSNGTTFVVLQDFNYAAGAAIIANSLNTNSLFNGAPTDQSVFLYSKLERFGITGAGIGGTNGLTVPLFNLAGVQVENVDCTAFANTNGNDFIDIGSGSVRHSNQWICGAIGVNFNASGGLLTTPCEVSNSYFQSAGAFSAIKNGGCQVLNTSGNISYAGGGACSGATNYAVQQTIGFWSSFSDRYAGAFITGGTTNLHDMTDAGIGPCGSAINMSGASTVVSAQNTRIDTFTQSAGTFNDEGRNFKTAPGTAWGTGTLTITGGSINSNYVITGKCTGVATASQTIFLFPIGALSASTCTVTAESLLTGAGVVTQSATLAILNCTATAGGVNASSGVVTVRKGGVNSALTATFGTGTTARDVAHSVAVVPGDIITIQFTTQAAETLAGVACSVQVQ